MKLYQDAWYLFKTEVQRSKVNLVMVFSLVMLTIVMSASTYFEILGLTHPTFTGYIDFVADYFFILTFGCAGIFLTFVYGGGFKKDVLADRLAYYRSLPISTEHIVISKIISALVGTFVSLLIYFLAIVSAFSIFADLKIAELGHAYIVHGLVLFAAMMLVNYVFVWVDLCKTYKWYTIFSFVFVFLLLFSTIFLQAFSEKKYGVIVSAYRFSEQYPLIAVILSIIVLVLSTLITYKAVTPILRKRNLG